MKVQVQQQQVVDQSSPVLFCFLNKNNKAKFQYVTTCCFRCLFKIGQRQGKVSSWLAQLWNATFVLWLYFHFVSCVYLFDGMHFTFNKYHHTMDLYSGRPLLDCFEKWRPMWKWRMYGLWYIHFIIAFHFQKKKHISGVLLIALKYGAQRGTDEFTPIYYRKNV